MLNIEGKMSNFTIQIKFPDTKTKRYNQQQLTIDVFNGGIQFRDPATKKEAVQFSTSKKLIRTKMWMKTMQPAVPSSIDSVST